MRRATVAALRTDRNHEIASHLLGDLGAAVFLDHCQAEIDTGGDTG